MRGALCVVAGLLVASGAPRLLDAQQPIARTTTAGVLIDVSVLDRDGMPVLDLRADEFEVAEDGKRQQILAATLVNAGTSIPGAAPAARSAESAAAAPQAAAGSGQPAAIPEVPLTVTAILFDRLSPEVRATARQAAQAYLSTLSPPNDYAGVFVADLALVRFAPFTNQQPVLRDGLDRASIVATAARDPGQRGGTALTSGLSLDPNQAPTAGAESASGFISPLEREKALNASGPEGPLRRMELRMSEGYQQFLKESEGQAALAGLRTVVDALSLLPGRKSVMYFTEGLPITARLKPRFDALIGEANRSNITIYPVDAAGLRVHSEDARLSRDVGVAASQGLGDAKRDEGAYTKELERQEQLLTSRPTAALGRLAKETGGFLLENTNNLAAGVARMQQERTTYYLLAYQPINAAADGKYRRIEVKVKRPRVTVKARPGYTAATGAGK